MGKGIRNGSLFLYCTPTSQQVNELKKQNESRTTLSHRNRVKCILSIEKPVELSGFDLSCLRRINAIYLKKTSAFFYFFSVSKNKNTKPYFKKFGGLLVYYN